MKSSPTSPTVVTQAIAVRPDIAAQMLGVTPFRVEEWMRDGSLRYYIPPETDTRVILISDLQAFVATWKPSRGALARRGVMVAKSTVAKSPR